jgi:glycosyltransferase involved in cell wall biosynthesis
MTLISVVMPCFQQVRFLGQAVESVLSQEDVEVELLVLDPGSTDGSRELLLELHRFHGDRLRLFLAPDLGQSDAVNRGMALARGRVLGWLNSDDYLLPGALRRVMEGIGDQRGASWLYGRATMVDEAGCPVCQAIVRYKNWRGRRFSFFKLLTENFIPQMAVFWNRQMWGRAGGLDINRHLDMDYDLWLRFAAVGEPVTPPVDLAAFRVHPGAKSSRQRVAQLRAARDTARRHSTGQGWRGKLALLSHGILSGRNRLCYSWMKPTPLAGVRHRPPATAPHNSGRTAGQLGSVGKSGAGCVVSIGGNNIPNS